MDPLVKGLALIYYPHTLWSFSGSERRFIMVSKYLKRDHGVDFESLESYPPLNSLLETYHKAHPVNLSGNVYANLIEWLFKGLAGIHRLRGKRFDFVYATNNNIYNTLLGLLAKKLLSKPLVVVVHHLRWVNNVGESEPFSIQRTYAFMRKNGLGQVDSVARAFGSSIENLVLKRADALIAISNAVATNLRLLGYSERIFLSGNGIDEKYLDFKPTVSQKKYDAIYVGRLDEGKGVLDLVRLWRTIIDCFPDAKLAIVGKGVFYSEIFSLIKKEGLDKNIQLTGYIDDEELILALYSSKIFVTLSTVEGWGLSIGEALACGLPVICYGIPSLREIFGSSKNVIFIKTGDVKKATEEIAMLLRNGRFQIDKPENLYNLIQKFSWKEVAEKEFAGIKSVMKGNV